MLIFFHHVGAVCPRMGKSVARVSLNCLFLLMTFFAFVT